MRTLRRLSTRPSFRFCKQTNHWIVAIPEYLQDLAAETDWEDEKQLKRLIIKYKKWELEQHRKRRNPPDAGLHELASLSIKETEL